MGRPRGYFPFLPNMLISYLLACANSRPSSLPARVALPGAKKDGCFRRLVIYRYFNVCRGGLQKPRSL